MKTFLLCLLMAASVSAAHAINPDSLAYQLQRKKINSLLDQRSQKFSQYSQSLNTKTGIFGWQTKKDIRRSGEILMDIAHTDENIFKEIKNLLDYKTFQATQVVAQSHESEDRVTNYMVTINKLRQQNDKLKQEQNLRDDEYRKTKTIYIIVILLLIATSIFLFFSRNKSRVG
ncbi:hypothetical protein [Mucilaginibacter paludis]|uniref:Uncharacterized protein n=1 Tax=Mucilaginibacter paludis DSM 18603 TaxID=714943 RepID=H1YC57_9SPHI|nr:hypothetical protein [Mucilaginibacter paludis]EHQ29620.1 hypothetical protein Mucpa_5549 [Mucilaginibacter paludis DSM 18603]